MQAPLATLPPPATPRRSTTPLLPTQAPPTPPHHQPQREAWTDYGEQKQWYEETLNSPYAGGNVLRGVRIASYGAGSGAEVRYGNVIGANGGTRVGTIAARYGHERFGVQIDLPFTSYRVPQDRDIGLGNLKLSTWYTAQDSAAGFIAIGLEAHGNLGERSYTWANEARELWPGYGAGAAIQVRRTFGDLTTLGRGYLGAHTSAAHSPVIQRNVLFELAFALDYRISSRFGAVFETSFSYWDLSPWDTSLLVRADLVHGLRARGGVVLPVGVWAGLSPLPTAFEGVREATIVGDLSLAF